MAFGTATVYRKEIERDADNAVIALVYYGRITDTEFPDEPPYDGAVRIEGEQLQAMLALPEPDRSVAIKDHLAAVAKERHAAWVAGVRERHALQRQAAPEEEVAAFPVLTAADLPA